VVAPGLWLVAPGPTAPTSEAAGANAVSGPFGGPFGSPRLAELGDGLLPMDFFGSQGKAWLPQGFPEPPLPANLSAPTGHDNLRMKDGAMVLKHAASWGFIGGAAASAKGLNNLSPAGKKWQPFSV